MTDKTYNLYLNTSNSNQIILNQNSYGQVTFYVVWNNFLPVEYDKYRVSVIFMSNIVTSNVTNQVNINFNANSNVITNNAHSNIIPIFHVYTDSNSAVLVSRRINTNEFTINRPTSNNLYVEVRNTAESGYQTSTNGYVLILQFTPCQSVYRFTREPKLSLPVENFTLVLKTTSFANNITSSGVGYCNWYVDFNLTLPPFEIVNMYNVYYRFITETFSNTGGYSPLLLSLDIGGSVQNINSGSSNSNIIGVITTQTNSTGSNAFYTVGSENIYCSTITRPKRNYVNLQILNPTTNALSSVQTNTYSLYLTFEPIF